MAVCIAVGVTGSSLQRSLQGLDRKRRQRASCHTSCVALSNWHITVTVATQRLWLGRHRPWTDITTAACLTTLKASCILDLSHVMLHSSLSIAALTHTIIMTLAIDNGVCNVEVRSNDGSLGSRASVRGMLFALGCSRHLGLCMCSEEKTSHDGRYLQA